MMKKETVKTKEIQLRVVVFNEDGWIVAQCLEHDIAVQSKSHGGVLRALTAALYANIALACQHGIEPLSNFKPAPAEYEKRFSTAPFVQKLPLQPEDHEPEGTEKMRARAEFAFA